MYIYMHIPKTAGSTLRKIISKQYKTKNISSHHTIKKIMRNINKLEEQIVELIKKTNSLAEIECLQGHLPFALIETVLKKHNIKIEPSYIALIRHPLDRVISQYCHYIKHHKYISIKNFLGSKRDYVNNLQSSYISGELEPTFTQTINNIQNHFSFIGTCELFDQSLYLMKKKFLWSKSILYKKYNVRLNPLTKEQLSADIIKTIMNKNKLDLKLYKYVEEKVLKKIKSLDVKEKEELNSFCQINKETKTSFSW